MGYMGRILAVAVIVLVLVSNGSIVSFSEEKEFDGAVLAEIFLRLVDLIISGDYVEAENIINDLRGAYVPSDIEYLHRIVYEKLDRVVNDLVEIRNVMDHIEEMKRRGYVEREFNETITRLKELTIKLYGDKLRLENDLKNYISELIKYISVAEKTYYSRMLNIKVHNLLRSLDDEINYLIDYINRLLENIGVSYAVDIGHVERFIPAGSTITIPVEIIPLNKTPLNNLSILITVNLWYGYWYLEEHEFKLVNKTRLNITLRLLDARGIYEKNIPFKHDPYYGFYYVNLYGIVYCFENHGGKNVIVGKGVFNTTLTLYIPPISFITPQVVNYGENVTVKIVSNAEYPVNTTIRIDGNPIGVITVYPGVSEYTIPHTILDKGYHTIAFKTSPVGKYIGLTHTVALAVVGTRLRGVLKYSRICIQPFSSYVVEGIIYDSRDAGEIRLAVYLNGNMVFNKSISHSFTEEISFPLTLFASVYNVEFMVTPSNQHYDPLVVETKVIVINIATLLLLPFILLALVFIEAPGDIASIYRVLIGGARRAFVQPRRIRHYIAEKTRAVEFLVLTRIRKSFAAEIYWRLVDRFPRLFPRAEPTETLREYYRRSKNRLPRDLRGVFKKLTLLVEKDLYSLKKPSRSIVVRLVKRVEDELGK